MKRRQIYLTEKQEKELVKLSKITKENVSALICRAIDLWATQEMQRYRQRKTSDKAFLKALDNAFGIWADRDPKEFEETRRSADRRLDEWGV